MTVHLGETTGYRLKLRELRDRHYDVLTGEAVLLAVSLTLAVVLAVIL